MQPSAKSCGRGGNSAKRFKVVDNGFGKDPGRLRHEEPRKAAADKEAAKPEVVVEAGSEIAQVNLLAAGGPHALGLEDVLLVELDGHPIECSELRVADGKVTGERNPHGCCRD